MKSFTHKLLVALVLMVVVISSGSFADETIQNLLGPSLTLLFIAVVIGYLFSGGSPKR